MRKRLFILAFVISQLTNAQFKIEGVFRLRTEFKDGVKTLSDSTKNPAYTLTQRTRLNFGFNEDKLAFYVSLYDARVWGESAVSADMATLGVSQAYVQYSLNPLWDIKLGRQELSYDKNRLLANRDWNTIGASHDVGLLKLKIEKTQAHLGFAYNNDTDKLFESEYNIPLYKHLTFLWLNHKFNHNYLLSIMNIYDGNQKEGAHETIYTRGTSGFLLTASKEALSLDLSAYLQYGKHKTGQDISAYFFLFSPTFQVNDNLKLTAGIEYYSGNDALSSKSTVTAFSNLYGAGHAYRGYMDYFTDVQSNTKGGGLNDMHLKAALKTSEKVSLHAALHHFSLANNVIDSISVTGQSRVADKQLGTELDLTMHYEFHKNSVFSIGYSSMLPSKSMEILKGGNAEKLQHWLWFSVSFKPELFSSYIRE